MVEDVEEESDGMLEDEEDSAMADGSVLNHDQARSEPEVCGFVRKPVIVLCQGQEYITHRRDANCLHTSP